MTSEISMKYHWNVGDISVKISIDIFSAISEISVTCQLISMKSLNFSAEISLLFSLEIQLGQN